MALVEITAVNLFAGASLRKLEVGSVVEVDDDTAERWKSQGKAKDTDKRKGERLLPATSQSKDDNQLNEAAEELAEKLAKAEAELKAKDTLLVDEKARADKAEAELKALQEAANKPQEKAEGGQAESEKKGK